MSSDQKEREIKPRSTAEEVMKGVDVKGKTVLITGTSAGLGTETARVFLKGGAKVIGAVRNVEKMKPIAEKLKTETGNEMDIVQCDLSDIESIKKCGEEFKKKYEKLDILICNAGVMATDGRRETKQGFEFQFGVNHLGHYVFVGTLIDLLVKSKPSRVVVLSSSAHKIIAKQGFVFEDLQQKKAEKYNTWVAYSRSKSANILFAAELQRKYGDKGVTVFSCHPGVIMTELQREVDPKMFVNMGWTNEDGSITEKGKALLKTIPQGASTQVWCATAPELEGKGGAFCEDNGLSPKWEGEDRMKPGYGAHVDPEKSKDTASKLWTLSEELTKFKYGA